MGPGAILMALVIIQSRVRVPPNTIVIFTYMCPGEVEKFCYPPPHPYLSRVRAGQGNQRSSQVRVTLAFTDLTVEPRQVQ